jgi:hypothetical protein
MRRNFFGLLVLTWALMHLSPAEAEPTIISLPPASGLSPSAAIVFTFSEAMDPAFTAVDFYSLSPFATLPTTDVWSGGNTILTCTPSPAFPPNQQVVWTPYGQNLAGDPLGGTLLGGIFTTGTGSGSTGNGTNASTTFSVGKTHHYNQTSAGAPTLDPFTPYDFSGVTSLASNRTVTSITLTLPTAAVSNMFQLPQQLEKYIVYGVGTVQSTYDATFPPGNYTFFAQAAASNQTVVVNLPTTSSLPQPGAPHLTNYVAAQSVNPNQPFVLGWDAYAGGTAADYIDVDIGTAYLSPDPGLPGALNGTARTFTIPAGVLQPNSNYLSRVGFFHFVGSTNASYAAAAFRATYIEFSLITTSATPTGQLILTNANWTPSAFSFDVLCTNGQTVTIEYTNALSSGTWPKLLTTNSTGSLVHIVSTQSVSSPRLFYRARNGP